MSKVELLRAFVNQRLTLAAGEIFVYFERTIAEHEEELCRLKEENERQQKLLDAVFTPQLRLRRLDLQEQQKGAPPRPPHVEQEAFEPPHIKEEHEEVWSVQETEHALALDDTSKFTFHPLCVKSEEDGEKAQSSQLHQRQRDQLKTGSDGDVCGTLLPPAVQINVGPLVTVFIPQLQVRGKDLQEQQEGPPPRPPRVEQEDFEPPHIKEEHEELWSGQEREHALALDEEDTSMSTIHPLCVKSKDDGEKPQSSQLHQKQRYQLETGSDRDTCETLLQPEVQVKIGEFSDSVTDCVSVDLRKTSKYDLGLNSADIIKERRSLCCTKCGKTFKRKEFLKKHEKTHMKKKPFYRCGKEFQEKHLLTSHMLYHKEPFSCSVCSKIFGAKQILTIHMRTHTAEKPFSCSICSRKFSAKQTLTTHMITHTGEKTFNCSECGRSFYHKQSLTSHMLVHTGEKPFSCSICSKRFFHKCFLTKHMRIHTGEKPFSCLECGKRFTHKNNLAVHVLIHTGEKPFSCSECGKRFTQKNNLAAHIIIHTGEKPFSCSECGKRFIKKYHMARHMKTHTGEKPFSCSECGKKFIRKQQVISHMLVHTGEKPFSCSICSKRFIENYRLTRHMQIHTGEKPFSYSE